MQDVRSPEVEGSESSKELESDKKTSPSPGTSPEEKRAGSVIAIDPRSHMLVARDNAELMRMISIFMKGQSFPKTMDTPAKCITAWNMAASFKNVSPQRAMSRMMYINDTLSIWGELPKALAEETKELEDFELYVVDKDYNKICVENKNLHVDPYAGVCFIKRKGRTKNQYYFTMDEAEKAGLLNKKGPWQNYAKAMLCWRAQGQGLKFEFGDALMGCEIAEYRFNEAPDLNGFKDVSPKSTALADELNKTYSDEPKVDLDHGL